MTSYPAVLKELMIAGYQGAQLFAAFERMCAAIGGGVQNSQNAQTADVVVVSPARAKRTQADIVPVTFEAMPAPENAKAIAQKALNLSGLSGAAVAVGGQLIEHLNLATGRCDPGRARLAAKAGVVVRTVHRAIKELTAAGLFAVDRHGGLGHRSAFAVNWPEMQRIVALGENARGRLGSEQHGNGQKSPAQADNNVRQNQLRKPDSDSMMGKPQRPKPGRQPDGRQREMILAINGGRQAASSADVAQEEARKRLWHDVTMVGDRLEKAGKVALYLAYNVSPDIDDAVAMERQRRGSGAPWLIERLKAAG